MFCSYCGAQNEAGSRFCKSCGRELMTTPNGTEGPNPSNMNSQSNDNIHNSIIRKSIKKDAKSKPKGSLCGATVIYFIAMIVVIFVSAFIFGTTEIAEGSYHTSLNTNTLGLLESIGLSAFIMIFSTYFILAMGKISLDISRGNETSIGKGLVYPFSKIKNYGKLYVITLVTTIIVAILNFIPGIGAIANLVFTILVTPILGILTYVLIDNEELSIIDALKKANELVRGHRVAYYALVLSFIGWYVLSIFTIFALLIWIVPYVNISLANYYLSIKNEKVYNTEPQGISDGGILAITVIGYIIFIIALIAIIFSIVFASGLTTIDDSNKGWNLNDSFEYDDNGGEVKEISGLNIYVPDDYIETSLDNYDKVYLSPSGKSLLGIITLDLPNTDSKTYASVYQQSMQQASYSCTSPLTSPINHNDWEIVDCTGSGANAKSYINVQNGKLYQIVITYDPSERHEVNDLYDDLERELSFANQVA